jgi:hypothetical protein
MGWVSVELDPMQSPRARRRIHNQGYQDQSTVIAKVPARQPLRGTEPFDEVRRDGPTLGVYYASVLNPVGTDGVPRQFGRTPSPGEPSMSDLPTPDIRGTGESVTARPLALRREPHPNTHRARARTQRARGH